MRNIETKNEKMMYFPSVKESLKLGMIVSMTTIAVSLLITGINTGMTMLLSLS